MNRAKGIGPSRRISSRMRSSEPGVLADVAEVRRAGRGAARVAAASTSGA